MAGYLKTPPGHAHFPGTHHPTLGAPLSGMAMPGLSPFGLPHHLEPVGFPQGNYLIISFLHTKNITKSFFIYYRLLII